MSSYNNRGLNNNNGGGQRGGEYNNDDGAGANKQEFVTPSLCIPRTHANIRKERLFAVFRSLGLGWIGRIDVVEKTDESSGAPFIRVFIHFTKWFQNAQTRQFLERLETQKSANIVYDEPWFWKVTKSFVSAPTLQQQQQQQQPSRFPKPRIDFDGVSSRVQEVAAAAAEVVGEIATAASKTPSSNPSGTNAVSGKGKEVAKRMGYESGKGLGKNADGRLVPVQIKKNIGRNGVGLGCGSAVVDVAADVVPSSEYWTKVAEEAAAATAVTATTTTRLSVSISPPKLERRLFHDDGVASAPAKASSHDVSAAAAAIWQSKSA
jgi:G-patch domain